VAARLLIESGKHLEAIDVEDLTAFEAAIGQRETRNGGEYKHYRHALFASRSVLYHLGAPAEPVPKRSTLGRWSWERYLDGVNDSLRRSMASYLERLTATLSHSTVSGTASELAHFGRFLARNFPEITSFAELDRRSHVEPYLSAAASAINHRTGAPIEISTRRSCIQAVGRMFEAMGEWGWQEAPRRRLIFARDGPRLPRPLPRYLPPDKDCRLVEALECSPNRLLADGLLLMRASGIRIGELRDLELDCVHEVPGQGAWLRIGVSEERPNRCRQCLDLHVSHRPAYRPMMAWHSQACRESLG